jgi:Right handed beta helix region
MTMTKGVFVAIAAALLGHVSLACALASRAWVSAAIGDDVNPCTRTQPCKTFARAIVSTAADGAIEVIDNGSFGAVTITKPVTIEGAGNSVGIGWSSGNAVTVNTPGASDMVVLRGLQLDGGGAAGIRVFAVGKLVIERCTIQNFTTHGVDFESTTSPSYLLVSDTTINGNIGMSGTSSGVYIAAASVNAVLDRVRIVQNGIGLQVRAGAVSVRDSAISGNSQANVKVIAVGAAHVAIDGTLISDSVGGNGIAVQGFAANVWLSNSTVTGNNVGLSTLSGAINSFGNNRIFANTSDGVTTTTLPQQ